MELESETQVLPMGGRVVWSRTPLTLQEARARYGNDRHHLLYVAVDASGRPVKVGESTQLGGRYTPATARRHGIHRLYVGRVVDEQGRVLMGSYVTDAERLVARKLQRMGVALRAASHRRPNPREPVITIPGRTVRLDRAVPAAMRQRQLRRLRSSKRTPGVAQQLAEARRAHAAVDGRTPYELERLL